MSALLVTGSRALNDTPGARAWAIAILTEQIAALPVGSALWTGGCPRSPDAWAEDIAAARGITRITYHLDGWVHRDGKRTETQWAGTEALRLPRTRWPLERNRVMVQEATVHSPTVCALHAPWATTHGTAHTVRLAREVGMRVSEYTCPATLGRVV